MIKPQSLIYCCLLILVPVFSRSAVSAQALDGPIEGLLTVQTRREALAQVIAEREQWGNTGDPVLRVKANNRIAELYLKLFDLDLAYQAANDSLAIARQFAGTNNAALLADTLILAGRSHIRRGENETALPLLEDALDLSDRFGYYDGKAQSLAQIAVANYELSKHGEAEAKNNEALDVLRQQPNTRVEAQILTTQGEIFIVVDRLQAAGEALTRAEALWRSLGDADELANNLLNQGFMYIKQGQWHTALALLNQAQALLPEKEAEPYLAGKVAMTLGEVYEAYGELDTSLTYIQEALHYYRDLAHDKRATVDAGNQAGRLLALLDRYDEARQQIQQALNVALEAKNNLNIGLCHTGLGIVWLKTNSYESARAEFLAAANFFTLSNTPREVARVQMYLGQTEYLLGNPAQSGAAYENALRFFQTKPDYTLEAALRLGLGKLALKQGQLNKAEEHLRRSIELTQRLRLYASSRELRSSFLASVHDRYETYGEILMTRSLHENNKEIAKQAFEVNESGRALALLDSINNSPRELRRSSDPVLFREEVELQTREQQLVDEQAKLVGLPGVEKERARIAQELTDLKANYETLQARINSSRNFNNLLAPLSYEEIKSQLIDNNTSILSYSLGDTKSFAWLLTKDGFDTYELPDKPTIQHAANQLIALLKSPAANSAEQAQLQTAINEVSRLVVGNVATNLRTPRLIVIADGILQYIPFQILKPNPDAEPLISRFEIVSEPSASALAIAKRERNNRQPAPQLVIGFGDAVFSSDYTPHGSQNADSATREAVSRLGQLPRLFNAKRELSSIEELVRNESAFYVEYDATRENLLKANLSDYRILHVATHGVLDTDQPELSGLVFSMVDAKQQPLHGFLSLAEIYNLRAPVDLVVLSACHTAVGKEVRGEGLVGLTRGFMYAGASGVVASLWQVNDRATAELMKNFYTNMLEKGMSPPAALRAAQNTIRSQKEWSSPYYWAGFTFQGDYDLTIRAPRQSFPRIYLIVGGAILLILFGIIFWRVRNRWKTVN